MNSAGQQRAIAVCMLYDVDMGDVIGFEVEKKALAQHVRLGTRILLVGPAGCGKTMLVRRCPAFVGPDAPFRAPHHTCSGASLCAERERAAQGVLFLDELVEFRSSDARDLLRHASEDVCIIAAANPCPCAHGRARSCKCAPSARQAHERRLANLYRCFDVIINIGAPTYGPAETSARLRRLRG